MINVLFVCFGNICRSPMAEFLFKDMLKKRKLENDFYVASAATNPCETGNPVHYGTKNKLNEYGISTKGKYASLLKKSDYDKYDFIIGMEESNIKDIINILGDDKEKKVYKLLQFENSNVDIDDPWYTGDFDKTYEDISRGLTSFLDYLTNIYFQRIN